jgi:hypothetical protein
MRVIHYCDLRESNANGFVFRNATTSCLVTSAIGSSERLPRNCPKERCDNKSDNIRRRPEQSTPFRLLVRLTLLAAFSVLRMQEITDTLVDSVTGDHSSIASSSRSAERVTEHAHRRVAAIRSAQYVVMEREALERGTILTHGDLVVCASVIVIEHRQRQDFTRLCFVLREVHECHGPLRPRRCSSDVEL